MFKLHNLDWTFPLIDKAARGDEEARALVDEVMTTWFAAHGAEDDSTVEGAWHSHTVSLRTQIATCAVALLDLDAARPLVEVGVAWLQEPAHDDGDWNHGFDQALTLLAAGCVTDDEGLVDDAVFRIDRHRRNAVDDQGVTNEQAPRYQRYVISQYADAIAALRLCGRDTARFEQTRRSMLPMAVHATRPDATMAQLGDTDVGTNGLGPDALPTGKDTDTVAVYDRGFAFGRDSWADDASWFSLRFGDARVFHGHRDHGSLTWDVDGRSVLAEAGFSGYAKDEWREYERSHRAHNVVTVEDGGRFLWDRPTPLVHQARGQDHLSLTVEGRPYANIDTHRRSVVASFDPQVMVVRDVVRSSAARSVDQLWHLPAGWDVTSATADAATATGPDGRGLRIMQLADRSSVEVTEAATDPLQGHVAVGSDQRAPAPVVSFGARGRTTEQLTVLAPTGPGVPEVTVTRDRGTLEITADGRTHWVTVRGGNLVRHATEPAPVPAADQPAGNVPHSPRFTDIGRSVFNDDIQWLAAEGITAGCNPPTNTRFCPDDAVTRGQMAAFLVRALALPAADRDRFRDDDTSIFERDVQALAAADVTAGCNPPSNTRFCPDGAVTRGQMAAFLVRALNLPSSERDRFRDRDPVFQADIRALAAAGITSGCNPPTDTRFCPDDAVTRGQLAAFLRRALG